MAWTSNPTGLVLVDGPSGAGKTDYASALALRTGATLVSLDEVYPGWDGLDAGSWHIHHHVIVPIAQGLPGRYQRWDWMASAPGDWVDVPVDRPLVIEGCGAIRAEALSIPAHRLWVDASSDVRKARALARDGEIYAPHWQRWALQEQRFLARHNGVGNADTIVATDKVFGVSNGA